MRIAELVERRAAAVTDAQAALDFLRVGDKQAALGIVEQGRREPRLLLHDEIALAEALQHQRQVGIALTFVEGAFLGIDDGTAGAWLDTVAEGLRVAAEFLSLIARGAQLFGEQQARDDAQGQKQQPENDF